MLHKPPVRWPPQLSQVVINSARSLPRAWDPQSGIWGFKLLKEGSLEIEQSWNIYLCLGRSRVLPPPCCYIWCIFLGGRVLWEPLKEMSVTELILKLLVRWLKYWSSGTFFLWTWHQGTSPALPCPTPILWGHTEYSPPASDYSQGHSWPRQDCPPSEASWSRCLHPPCEQTHAVFLLGCNSRISIK